MTNYAVWNSGELLAWMSDVRAALEITYKPSMDGLIVRRVDSPYVRVFEMTEAYTSVARAVGRAVHNGPTIDTRTVELNTYRIARNIRIPSHLGVEAVRAVNDAYEDCRIHGPEPLKHLGHVKAILEGHGLWKASTPLKERWALAREHRLWILTYILSAVGAVDLPTNTIYLTSGPAWLVAAGART